LRAADPGGGGLDAVLRLLWDRYAGAPDGYFEAHVLGAVREVGGEVLGDELAALVDRRVGSPGAPDLEDAIVAAVGLRWEQESGPTGPDLGVRTTESDAGVRLATVLRDRPAW